MLKNVKSDVNHIKSPLKCVLLIEAFPFAYQLYSTTLWPLGPGPLYAGLVEGRCHHGGQLAPWEAPRRRGWLPGFHKIFLVLLIRNKKQ